jgi:hypothetical protein
MDEGILARMNHAHNRDRVLGEFVRLTLDDVGPVGGETGMKNLQEIDSLADEDEKYLKSLTRPFSVRQIIETSAE